jgi:hypothetical protein
MVLNQHKLAIFESGQFAPKLCGQFTPKLPGQFQPRWVVSLFREKVVNFTVFSSFMNSTKRKIPSIRW